MAALHLVFRSPGESRALEQCLARVGEGDAVLLLEDGVYAAAEGSVLGGMPRAMAGRVAVYVLVPDLEARGLEIQNPLPPGEGRVRGVNKITSLISSSADVGGEDGKPYLNSPHPNPLPEGEGEKLREPYIEPVDYPGFVALTTEYNPIVSWT
jgi:tRNA 2-thiouridine synthesizing protein B